MMIGADPDELDRTAEELGSAALSLESAARRLRRDVYTAPWSGRDADTFRDDWARVHERGIAEAVAFLGEAEATLHHNATQQREAGVAGTGAVEVQFTGPLLDPPTPEELRDEYLRRALEAAGIDPDEWDPSAGVDGNREIIEKVYEYYAELYRDNPEMLWAGMAALIGPSFYAGFLDLDLFADMAAVARAIVDSPLLATIPQPLRGSLETLAGMTAEELEEEFRFYEQTLLQMQQDIFIDQATQHEAYAADGMTGIGALLEAGHIDQATFDAWAQIDEGVRTGDQGLIEAGNEALLWREQDHIINENYERMYDHVPTGPAMTYLMTLTGTPSVPGAQGFADVFPWETTITIGPDEVHVGTPDSLFGVDIPSVGVGVDVPNPTVTVVTPLPDGNVAILEDRWNLIQQDTLPSYLDLTRDEVLAELSVPVGERVDGYRFSARIDDLLGHLITDWELGVGIG